MLQTIPLRQKILVMIAVMSGLLMAALDQTIIATALGRIIEDFNAFNQLSWVVTAYLLTTTITVPISGKLSDQFGRRNLLLIGVSLFALTSLLSGVSQNIEQLIFFRALQGIGGGILTSSAFTIIGDLFSPRERGRWQGMIGGVFGLSSIIGPLLGGYLTDPHNVFGLTTNWRWTFFINVPVGIAALYMIARYAPNFKHEVRHRIDYPGAVTLAIALSSIILACENIHQLAQSLSPAWNIEEWVGKTVLLSIGAVFTGLFVWIERRATSPIVPLHLFKSDIFRIVMTATFLNGIAFLGAILYLTQFMQQVYGTNATLTGLSLLPMIIGLIATSATAGQIVTKTGKYKLLLLTGVVVATVSLLLLSTLTVNTPYVAIAAIMVLNGAGLGVALPIFNVAVQNDFDQKELGVVTSSVQLFRGLGSTIGTALLGGLLTAGVASSLGDLNKDPFIQTLQKQPTATQFIGNADANTALNLNSYDTKKKITDGIIEGANKIAAPTIVKDKIKDSMLKAQDDFSTKTKTAFSDSLQVVFRVAAATMGMAFIVTLFLREVPLSHDERVTPVET